MFNLKFGIVWTIITALIFIPFFTIPLIVQRIIANSDIPNEIPNELYLIVIPIFLFFSLFLIIGISFIRSGLKQVKQDKETDQYGIPTYGKVISIVNSGAYSNGTPELKAIISAFVPVENHVRIFEEIIGYAPSQYNDGDFLELLYYENDVNIIGKIDKKQISYSIIDKLENEPPVDEPSSNY